MFVRTRLHYDAVAQDKTQKKRGQGGVYASVAHSHRKKLCQRIVLPSRVKEILRRPQDWVRCSHWSPLCRHEIACTRALLNRTN